MGGVNGNEMSDWPPVRYIQPFKDETGQELPWDSVKMLRISHEAAENRINYCQIEIYGVDGINYALKANGGSAQQSSNYYPEDRTYGHAECVIDGDLNTFTETAEVPNGWLEVTLSEPRWIESFVLFNSGFDMCIRANNQLVQLFDHENRVVYEHRISLHKDMQLFNPDYGCSLKFFNEESRVVMLKLTLEMMDSDCAKVLLFHSLSGEGLGSFEFSISEPEAAKNLGHKIYELTEIPLHQQRLLLDDKILRTRAGQWQPEGSLQEICPQLLTF